jgi:predicted enzyme related to lactoylglutathione lyase
MGIRRVVPDIHARDIGASRPFCGDFRGLAVAMDMSWIVTCAGPANPHAQVTLLRKADLVEPQPDISIEVDDVGAVHAQAPARGLPIVHPLTDAPRGVRPFVVLDPHGLGITILSHREATGREIRDGGGGIYHIRAKRRATGAALKTLMTWNNGARAAPDVSTDPAIDNAG